MRVAYNRGLHELGDGLFSYLQPYGGWGLSNASLVTGDGASLLVDTLLDLRSTRAMLDAMRAITDRHPIEAAMNTHGHADHCYGNQLLPSGAELYATVAATEELRAAPPTAFKKLLSADLGPEWRTFAEESFGRFDFDGIELRLADTTFDGELDLRVGARDVRLIQLGPAHTQGDAIVHVPDASVVFTGDILFIEGTPLMFYGPVSNWLTACDRILALGAKTLVPGHGPVTDASGVRDVQRYLIYVRDEARARFDAGMNVEQAADDIDLSGFSDWGDPERIVVNVDTLYREFAPQHPEMTQPEHFQRMARWAARH